MRVWINSLHGGRKALAEGEVGEVGEGAEGDGAEGAGAIEEEFAGGGEAGAAACEVLIVGVDAEGLAEERVTGAGEIDGPGEADFGGAMECVGEVVWDGAGDFLGSEGVADEGAERGGARLEIGGEGLGRGVEVEADADDGGEIISAGDGFAKYAGDFFLLEDEVIGPADLELGEIGGFEGLGEGDADDEGEAVAMEGRDIFSDGGEVEAALG